MITETEIGEIFYDKCRVFNTEMYIKDNLPFKEITTERIIIIPSKIQTGKYWHESVVKINWCVPDIASEAQGERIKTIEKILKGLYEGIGEHEGRFYTYKHNSHGVGSDTDMRCHYANLILSFKIQNIL